MQKPRKDDEPPQTPTALRDLVRLLARQAAREAFKPVSTKRPETEHDE